MHLYECVCIPLSLSSTLLPFHSLKGYVDYTPDMRFRYPHHAQPTMIS